MWMLLLVAPNIEAATWGLIAHHADQWGDASLRTRVDQIVTMRAPLWLRAYANYLLLFGITILFGARRLVAFLAHHRALTIVSSGLVLLLLPNIVSGGFYAEYFTPILLVFFIPLAAFFVETHSRGGLLSTVFLKTALLSAIVLGIIRGGMTYIDLSGGQTPIDELKAVADEVGKIAANDDYVLALEALSVVVEANMRTPMNMTMAQFSLYEGDTKTAERLNLVNAPMLLRYIDRQTPHIVILTETDWKLLKDTGMSDEIATSLNARYEHYMQMGDFGQNRNKVWVYRRREGSVY
jgi:hypothetical protein